MLNIIIFSTDRAAQCDVLLQSIEQHFSCQTATECHIVYSASAPEFKEAYAKLSAQHSHVVLHEFTPNVQSKQSSFARFMKGFGKNSTDTIGSILQSILQKHPHDATLFLQDSSVFFRRCSLKEREIQLICKSNGKSYFSLSLGLNIAQKPQKMQDWSYFYGYHIEGSKNSWSKLVSFNGGVYANNDILSVRSLAQSESIADIFKNLRTHAAQQSKWIHNFCYHYSSVCDVHINEIHAPTKHMLNDSYLRNDTFSFALPHMPHEEHIDISTVNFHNKTAPITRKSKEREERAQLVRSRGYRAVIDSVYAKD